MGLRSTIADAVGAAFDAVGDLKKTVTYKSVSGAVYDDETGDVTQTSTDTTLSRVIFLDFRQDEVDSDVAVLTDMKMLFPRSDLAAVPKPTDVVIETGTGRTWEVKRLLGEPAEVLATLHVRSSR